MFVSVKKRTLLIIAAVIVMAVAVCGGITVASTAAYAVPKLNKLVVIDAGHGGMDGGVVGVKTGVKESEINLAISKNLKHYLKTKGYDVVMTRVNSDGLYGFETKNKKAKDMEARRKIINEARPDLVISVHCNFYPRSNVRGSQVFYAPKSEDGQKIANVMQSILNASLEASKRVAMSGDYFILQCTEYPSLLVECGFLSNADDEKLLVSGKYQQKVAYSIFSGVHQILMGEDTGDMPPDDVPDED